MTETMGSQDVNVAAIMADTFIRLVVIESVKVLVWAPLYVAVTVLHVWLSNRAIRRG